MRSSIFLAIIASVLSFATAPALATDYGFSKYSRYNYYAPRYRQCESNYPEHGVYEATIVYGIDEVVSGPLFLPMEVDRNTLEYREASYQFFAERFGMDFDTSLLGIQVINDGQGGSANVFPLKTGEGSTHQVYAVDAQRIPKWRSKMPLTQIAFFDDGYFVTLETDFLVKGTFGGEVGIVLPAGTQLVIGEYRMFDDEGRLLEIFEYRSNIPVAAIPVGGSFQFSGGAVFITIACDVESKLFGSGDVRSLAQITPLPDGRTDLDFRYVMHFPSRLKDSDPRPSRCDNLRPLPYYR